MEMLMMKPFSPLHTFQIKNPKIHLQSQLFGSFRLNSQSPVSYRVSSVSSSSSSSAASFIEVQKMVQEFNPRIPIEEAITPPSCWYTDPCFYSLELQNVFFRGWQAVGYADLIKEPNQYFTGRLGNVEYVVCRDDSGKLHAFHNVCRHHASLIASGKGKKSCFVCPYHGWTYGLDGALLKATRISGIQNFKAMNMGLVHLRVAIWGPFVLINFEDGSSLEEASESNFSVEEWLGSSSKLLHAGGVDSSLSFVCRREYTVRCNWKVFCDNYLDGGYHVQYAHKGLASGLNLESYSTTIHEKVSIQSCEGGTGDRKGDIDRLGSKALYAFVYPNFMINRYGPWMDTNLVLPLGPDKCQVIFDYFLDASLKDDESFIEKSLKDSEEVQLEDIALSEGVQRGLESPAYNSGRYAPNVEKPMHHFHCLLYDSLNS